MSAIEAQVRLGVRRLRESEGLHALARFGIAARTGFYLLLAYLTARVAAGQAPRQDNAHGVLATVAQGDAGRALLAAAAAGFAAFAVLRFVAAYGDSTVGVGRRLTSAGQGLFYVGMAYVTASFVFGSRNAGSEQQHHATTARFLALPVGRWIVMAAGITVVAVAGWQVRTALSGDYDDGWDVEEVPAWLARVLPTLAVLGIVARALVFVPVGALLVVAGATVDSARAKGLDAVLAPLARSVPGRVALGLVVVGFTVFAVYSLVESRYRDLESGA